MKTKSLKKLFLGIILNSTILILHSSISLGVVGDYLPENDHPLQSCIILYSEIGKSDGEFEVKGLCSGTIISSKHILTAGHCEKGTEHLAPIIKCQNEKLKIITKRTVHPQFQGPTNQYDIAVLEIAEDQVFDTSPITLPKVSSDVKELINKPEKCAFFGYGLNNSNEVGVLHGIKYHNNGTIWGPGMVGAGGSSYPRQGDSGGGLYCRDKVNNWVRVGTVSSAEAGLASASTLENTLEWVNNQMGSKAPRIKEFSKQEAQAFLLKPNSDDSVDEYEVVDTKTTILKALLESKMITSDHLINLLNQSPDRSLLNATFMALSEYREMVNFDFELVTRTILSHSLLDSTVKKSILNNLLHIPISNEMTTEIISQFFNEIMEDHPNKVSTVTFLGVLEYIEIPLPEGEKIIEEIFKKTITENKKEQGSSLAQTNPVLIAIMKASNNKYLGVVNAPSMILEIFEIFGKYKEKDYYSHVLPFIFTLARRGIIEKELYPVIKYLYEKMDEVNSQEDSYHLAKVTSIFLRAPGWEAQGSYWLNKILKKRDPQIITDIFWAIADSRFNSGMTTSDKTPQRPLTMGQIKTVIEIVRSDQGELSTIVTLIRHFNYTAQEKLDMFDLIYQKKGLSHHLRGALVLLLDEHGVLPKQEVQKRFNQILNAESPDYIMEIFLLLAVFQNPDLVNDPISYAYKKGTHSSFNPYTTLSSLLVIEKHSQSLSDKERMMNQIMNQEDMDKDAVALLTKIGSLSNIRKELTNEQFSHLIGMLATSRHIRGTVKLDYINFITSHTGLSEAEKNDLLRLF